MLYSFVLREYIFYYFIGAVFYFVFCVLIHNISKVVFKINSRSRDNYKMNTYPKYSFEI